MDSSQPGEQSPPLVYASSGEQAVILRRMDALKSAITDRDWEQVEWHFDNVQRAITKAFRWPR